MTTPFADLEVVTKSASQHLSTTRNVTPFATLDAGFDKEAGVFGDMIGGAWNKAIKPIGQNIAQAGKGVYDTGVGALKATGDVLVAAPK